MITKVIQPANIRPYVPGTYPSPVDQATSVEQNAAAAAYARNEQVKADYLGMGGPFATWFKTYDSGRDRTTPPPAPPRGFTARVYEKQASADGTESSTGNTMDATFDLVQDGPPVCEIPAYAKLVGDPTLPAVPIQPKPQPKIIQATPGDTLPLGFIITAPDGTRWQKHASESPFGVAYYYEPVV